MVSGWLLSNDRTLDTFSHIEVIFSLKRPIPSYLELVDLRYEKFSQTFRDDDEV